MKPLIILLFISATSCSVSRGKFDPVQVNRSILTVDHLETKYRRSQAVCYIIWVDDRGTKYSEEMINANDTAYMRKGLMFAQLLKR